MKMKMVSRYAFIIKSFVFLFAIFAISIISIPNQVSAVSFMESEIKGVSIPVTGANSKTNIRENTQYTGGVLWSPLDSVFAVDTIYTATITLEALGGSSFDNIPQDFFQVSGAESYTNAAGSGIVAVTFPATYTDNNAPYFGANFSNAGQPGKLVNIGVTVNDDVSINKVQISFNGDEIYYDMIETPASINQDYNKKRRYTFNQIIPKNIQTNNYDYKIKASDFAGNLAIQDYSIDVIPASLLQVGSGSVNDPFQISTCEQLQDINYEEGEGNFPYLTGNYYFILTQDIDCSGTAIWNNRAGFLPIGRTLNMGGYYGWETLGDRFVGTFDGANHTIKNLYINRPMFAYVGLFGEIGDSNNDGEKTTYIKNLNIQDAKIYGSTGLGILAASASYSVFSNITTSGIVKSLDEGPTTFHLKKLNNGTYDEVYSHHFSPEFSTKNFAFENLSNSLTLEINQKNIPFAGIDSATLNACGILLYPKYATDKNGLNVLADILSIDNNIAIAHEKEIKISWDLPVGCTSANLSLTANEYGYSLPLNFSNSKTDKYKLGTNVKTLIIDGFIDEVSNMTPTYSPYWSPTTGHPSGKVYFYLMDDNNYLYLAADVTLDNTNDTDGQDWISLSLNGKTFLVNDNSDKYGKCSFGLTKNVSYKHQTCEMRIPKSEINTQNEILFNLGYYGTMGRDFAGGLAGNIYNSEISDSNSTASVIATNNIGGLIGSIQESTVKNSHAIGNVTGTYSKIGGLVGGIYVGHIENTYATGNVTGYEYVGGLVGQNIGENGGFNTIVNSYATGNVTGNGGDIGGLIGQNSGDDIYKSYATGKVTGSRDNVGGLVGSNYEGHIENTYATGNVSGEYSVGGLVGYTSGEQQSWSDTIVNSYATGNVTGTGGDVGGLVGQNYGDHVYNSYATGDVTSPDENNKGGLIGSLSWSGEDSYTDLIVNSGWYKSDLNSNLKGIGYVDLDQLPHDVTYLETDKTVFNNKLHGVYAQGVEGAWDYTTPIWYENINDNPKFLSNIPPTPEPTVTRRQSSGGSRVQEMNSVIIENSSPDSTSQYNGCTPQTTFSPMTGIKCLITTNSNVTSGDVSKITKNLKRGDKGEDVSKLQNYLNEKGYNCGIADGIFGLKTKAAVISFQKISNLTMDGIVGPMTRGMMK